MKIGNKVFRGFTFSKGDNTAQKTAETANLVTFTEEILNGKLHFLCSANLILSQRETRQKKDESVLTYLI